MNKVKRKFCQYYELLALFIHSTINSFLLNMLYEETINNNMTKLWVNNFLTRNILPVKYTSPGLNVGHCYHEANQA